MLSNRRSIAAIPPMVKSTVPNPAAIEPHSSQPSVLTATTPTLPGYRIVKILGSVHGLTVCSRKDTKAFMKSMGTASEARLLMHTLYSARDTATERMIKDCVTRGGNAVIGMSFGESEVLGFAQVSVYGTAVFVEKLT